MKLLKINLTNKSVSEKEITLELLKRWIGGRGFGAYLYSQDVRQPDDPQNSVFIMTGAVTGTFLPSSSRLEVVSSSPLTGYYQASSAGGYFGAYLRSQGIVGLQITGQAADWVYLEVKNGKVEIKDAKRLVGLNVYETRGRLGSGEERSVCCIGRAGENLVRFSCLQFDNRAAGRTGTGWHFGFKKLKAIVINKGILPAKVTNPEEAKNLVGELNKKRLDYEQRTDTTSYCTPQFTDYASKNYVYPASNYRRNHLSAEELEKVDHARFLEKVLDKEACWACPLGCTRITKSKFSDQPVKGPEYETIWALGASPEMFDFDVIIEATRLCDDYGLDTISTGAILGWYKECIDEGLVEDRWSPEGFLDLIKQIGERAGNTPPRCKENFTSEVEGPLAGNILAGGSLRASEEIKGSEKFLAHGRGLELPAWDPRGAWGMAICYATGPTGGDHCKGWTIESDIKDPQTRFTDLEARVKGAIEKQDFSAVLDSSGFCMFAVDPMLDWEIFARSFNAVLGTSFTVGRLKERAKEILNLEWKINRQLGHTLEENALPERIIGYEIEVEGKKIKLDQAILQRMLDRYYELRGFV